MLRPLGSGSVLANAAALPSSAVVRTAVRGLFKPPKQVPPKDPNRRIRIANRVRDQRPIILSQRAKNGALDAEAAQLNLGWRMVTATLVLLPSCHLFRK
jgi:hypothetical protein